jgi:hypothetical protein
MLDIIWSSGIITRRPLFLRLTMPFHPGNSSPPNADLLPGRQERQEVLDLPLRKVLRHALLVAAGGVGGVPLTAWHWLAPARLHRSHLRNHTAPVHLGAKLRYPRLDRVSIQVIIFC